MLSLNLKDPKYGVERELCSLQSGSSSSMSSRTSLVTVNGDILFSFNFPKGHPVTLPRLHLL